MVSVHHLVAIAVIIVQNSQTVHAQTYSLDGETCRRQCLGAYEFYRRFVISTEFLDNYLTSCYSRCPSVSTSTTTTTIRPTTTSTATSTSTSTSTSTTTRTSTSTTSTPTPIISDCGVPSITSRFRIVGGTTAARCEFPWVVAISIDRNFCGGSIIGKRYILTAAHCLRDKTPARAVVSPSIVTVRVGSSNLYEMKAYQVLAVNINPNHVPGYNDYDVAVLTLTEDLVYSDCVAPICLPNIGDDAAQAETCIAAGWGVTSFTSSSLTPDLQKVTLPIVSQALCNSSYGTAYINDLKFCAGNFDFGGIDSCQGDSGSPLMCYSKGRFYEYGIVSFGKSCAEPRYPGIYTKISHPAIRQFITAITG